LIVAFALAKYKMGNFASYFFLIPFITLGIGFLLLDEVPSMAAFLGGLLIILGILIKNKMTGKYIESKVAK
jgi:drug/metabolite transporter (DMT)-like permease